MARILIVEDDPAIQRSLADLLAHNGHEPLVATDFGAVPAQVAADDPDLVLLDLTLPEVDGTLICREVRAASAVPIIVVTSRTSELDEVMVMSMGADDFIAKPYSAHLLLAHVDAVLRRAQGAVGPRLSHGPVTLDLEASRVIAPGGEVELTRNELRILAYLMRRAGSVVARSDLMVELWNSDAFVDDNTLTVNVNRLRQTLAKVGVTDYLHTHRGLGYSV